jgi:ectoine hydroxylase-related dioxygenase (phytanoyl-CoA dioxygenase family)
VTWHQDGFVYGAGLGAFAVWVALTPSGHDCPGLSVVPRRASRVLDTGWGLAQFRPRFFELAAREHGWEDAMVDVCFEPGDALLFDEMTVHRTSVVPWRRVRDSAQAWFFAPGRFPPAMPPFVLPTSRTG